jgi:pantoate kinase
MSKGVLELNIKAFKDYEKNPTVENMAEVMQRIAEITPLIEEYQKLSIKFQTRMNAQQLGWLLIEETGEECDNNGP